MHARKGKILVIRGGAIGDFILTLPAVAALRRQFPDTHLEVLGYPHIAQLAVLGGIADRIQPIEARALAGFFARGGELAEELQDYFSDFNVIISYLFDPDLIFQTNVQRCFTGLFISAPHRPDERQRIHATAVFLNPLERLAIFDADPVPRLDLTSPAIRSKELAVHPGSGSDRKNWPEKEWAEFLQHFSGATKGELLLVGGEAEGQRLERLAAVLPQAQIAKSLPLTELASRLHSCSAFVGHDSGITHLAAALGLPTLVLWADSVEEIWRPQGKVRIVREAGGVRHISAARVRQELTELLTKESPGEQG